MKVDYDKFGHCVKCHAKVVREKVVTGPDGKLMVKAMFTKDRREHELEMSDGSKMRVCMCQGCLDMLTDSDMPVIMDSVVKGWGKELEKLDHWSDDRKELHMKKYKKLKIKVKEKKRPKSKKEK